MTKKIEITAREEIREMLERIRHENDALQRLIKALEEQSTVFDKEIHNKSNK
jgi:hypothetical protein